MTKIFNDPSDFAEEAVAGFCDIHSDPVRQVPGGAVRRHRPAQPKVAVLAGGGSGHYPAFPGLTAMKPYRYHDWCRLTGMPVEVRKDFEIVRTGVVDDAMEDSSALWIAADAGGGRTLFAAAEGFEVWIRPQELGGELCFKMAAVQLYAARR